MIKLLRVDQRLIHGQVAYSWGNELNVDCFLVSNDSLVNDSVLKTTLKIATPPGIKLVMKSIEDSIQNIIAGKTDKYKMLIVVKTIEDAAELVRGVTSISEINLGGIKEGLETHKIYKSINITDKEEKILKELIDEGVTINIQQVPSDAKRDIKTIINSSLGGEYG